MIFRNKMPLMLSLIREVKQVFASSTKTAFYKGYALTKIQDLLTHFPKSSVVKKAKK